MEKDTYDVLGMMSGTSLDGLDLAFCRFEKKQERWQFEILRAETIPYKTTWKMPLSQAVSLGGEDLSRLHVDYGAFLGKQALEFLEKYQLKPDFIACHGHTIFHQPDKRLTLQIGSGWEIAVQSGYPVIADFRSKDLALGGQGAPLVPIGDRFLFGDYDFCLNLGGIANISLEWQGKRIAYDVCPANMLLNNLVKDLGLEYDRGGVLAAQGNLDPELLAQWDALPYYQLAPPKSLGWEWYASEIIPLLQVNTSRIEDQLRTAITHIAQQIAFVVTPYTRETQVYSFLATGGGAKNTFLMEQIQAHLPANISLVIPEETIIDFKEALVFAFLGVLRLREEVNCLASVTGSQKDNCGGIIFLP